MKKYFVEVSEEETNARILRTKYYDSVEECHKFIKNIDYLTEFYHIAIMIAEGNNKLDYDVKEYEFIV